MHPTYTSQLNKDLANGSWFIQISFGMIEKFKTQRDQSRFVQSK